MRKLWFEFWYSVFGPLTAVLQLWFSFYAILNTFLPRSFVVLLAIPFIVYDILYNWVVASILFLEFPKETTLTRRIKRLHPMGVYGTDRFKTVANLLDPGHI